MLDELRDLAHGIHPTALSQIGLEEAVRSMAERYTIPIDVNLPPDRFGDAAELTAYYLIAESITNAVKHAQATRITIRGAKSGGYLQVTVIDDGRGGASAAAGPASAASSTASAELAANWNWRAQPGSELR